ncbi:hypothetical protein PIB30_092265 [Stylosanthes scabra]|uniref:Uncharacterized protein n=1 Tax=Stylosanthes scabra TaxID=79078 RepID=A0ABU6ZTG6_9FABA|nr:hypothetical protein [Stylosanthes scabra]
MLLKFHPTWTKAPVGELLDNSKLHFFSDLNRMRRPTGSDTRELKRVYHAYREYFMTHNKAFDLEQR